MIILDTNLVCEPLQRLRNPSVISWLDEQDSDSLYLTSTSLAELNYGVELLPDGTRKQLLNKALTELLLVLFDNRILAFNRESAIVYGALVANARLKGVNVSSGDAQIAAIAKVHGFSVGTLDAGPFEAMGIPVIKPWTDTGSFW